MARPRLVFSVLGAGPETGLASLRNDPLRDPRFVLCCRKSLVKGETDLKNIIRRVLYSLLS